MKHEKIMDRLENLNEEINGFDRTIFRLNRYIGSLKEGFPPDSDRAKPSNEECLERPPKTYPSFGEFLEITGVDTIHSLSNKVSDLNNELSSSLDSLKDLFEARKEPKKVDNSKDEFISYEKGLEHR